MPTDSQNFDNSEHANIDVVLNMAPNDQKIEAVLPAEVPEEMPLPSDPKATFLAGLFVLALLTTAFVAREIVLPLVFAIVLKLLLQPALRVLERLHIPRLPAALLLILALFGTDRWLGNGHFRPSSVPGQLSFRKAASSTCAGRRLSFIAGAY